MSDRQAVITEEPSRVERTSMFRRHPGMDYDKKLDDALIVIALSSAALAACVTLFLTV